MMQQTPIAIALGSNKGDRLAYLKKAYQSLKEDLLQEPAASSIYENPAWGGVATTPFLNAVVVGMTDWKPPAIVTYLKELERELGRASTQHLGDREIDLDLLAYNETTWESEGVTVPHPGMADRAFVLVPLVEVWPNWKHPKYQQTSVVLLAKLDQTLGRVLKINESL